MVDIVGPLMDLNHLVSGLLMGQLGNVRLGTVLFGFGCSLLGFTLGALCHKARLPLWVGFALFASIYLMAKYHS